MICDLHSFLQRDHPYNTSVHFWTISNHPLCQYKCSTERQQKLTFSEPTHPTGPLYVIYGWSLSCIFIVAIRAIPQKKCCGREKVLQKHWIPMWKKLMCTLYILYTSKETLQAVLSQIRQKIFLVFLLFLFNLLWPYSKHSFFPSQFTPLCQQDECKENKLVSLHLQNLFCHTLPF